MKDLMDSLQGMIDGEVAEEPVVEVDESPALDEVEELLSEGELSEMRYSVATKSYTIGNEAKKAWIAFRKKHPDDAVSVSNFMTGWKAAMKDLEVE